MQRLTTALSAALILIFTLPTAYAEDIPMDTSVVDRELDLYWAKNRELRTIQKKLFLKDSRHEFTLFSGVIPNDDFFSYFPMGLRWNYYFTEDLSAEVWGEYTLASESELKDFLQKNTLYAILVEIPQTLQWMTGVSMLWSPFHGKFALFTTKLVHFDFHVAFGAGVIGTVIIDEATKVEDSKIDPSGSVGVGIRMFINDLFSVRLDYRQYFYPASTGGVAYPAEITLGFSMWTDAPK